MQRPKPSSPSLPRSLLRLLGVTLLTALMATGFGLLAGTPKPKLAFRPKPPRSPGRTVAPAPSERGDHRDRVAARREVDPAIVDADATGDEPWLPTAGEGALELDFVSTIDGQPVPALPFIVFRESIEPLLLARAVSDADGRSRIEGLPAGELLIATMRAAPLAATTIAVLVPEFGDRRATVAVGPGGRATGRVVDDRGLPLPGIAIAIDPRPGPALLHDFEPVVPTAPSIAARFANANETIAVSDADGRYFAEALAPRPALFVAATDDPATLAPTRQEPLLLFAEQDGRYDEAEVAVAQHATARVNDLVLPRPIAFSGFVVDAAGRPVAGALVTSEWDRGYVVQLARPLGARAAQRNADVLAWSELGDADERTLALLPGEPGFAARRGEALTLASGRFDLDRVAPGCQQLWVVCADGANHSFLVDELEPGGRRSDLRLVLPRTTELFLRLSTDDGAPWDVAQHGGATVTLLQHDGTPFHAAAVATTVPGELALTSELPPEQVRAIAIQANDCERTTLRLRQPPAPRTVLDAVVRPFDALRLALELPGTAFLPESGVAVTVHACLATRAMRAATGEACCGLGERRLVTLTAETTAVELRLQDSAPWWITIEGPFVAGDEVGALRSVEFGPFQADGRTRALALPELMPATVASRASPLDAAHAEVRLRIVDGATRSTIEGAVIDSCRLTPRGGNESVADGGETTSGFWRGSDADGLLVDEVPLRTESLEIRAFGYEPSAPVALPRLAIGTTIDVGTVELVPRASFRIELVGQGEATGRALPPVAGCARLRPGVADAGGLEWLDVQTQFGADGVAELLGDLPDTFVLAVGAPAAQRSNVPQPWWELPLSRWERGTTATVLLPELYETEIVVDLAAVAAPLRAGNLEVTAAPFAGVNGLLTPRAASERDSANAAERRFFLLLPAGRFTLAAKSALFACDPFEFAVTERGAATSLRLLAR